MLSHVEVSLILHFSFTGLVATFRRGGSEQSTHSMIIEKTSQIKARQKGVR